MLRAIEWILFGAVSATSIIVGVRWHRPARIGPWILFAASIVCLAIGDVLYALGFQSISEFFYLTLFALVSMGLLQLTRGGGSILADRARLLDMLAFTCSTLLVIWVFVIGGNGMIGDVSASDIIGDLLVVGVAARLVAAAGWRNWSANLLFVGGLGMLVGDVLYPIWPGPGAETGYIVLYLAWGAAALHPSMVQLTGSSAARPAPWQGHWAALLGAAVATPPLVLLIEALTGQVRDGVIIAIVGGLTLMFTITRLADAVRLNARALSRERVLREATAALVAAADLPAVDGAVRCTVGRLLPDGALTEIVFATDDRQATLDALAPAEPGPSPRGPGAPAPAPARSWWARQDPGRGGEGTLVCPLWHEPLAVARPSGGALVLSGRYDALAAARDSLEVLAGQAALALDRISLVDAVGRRDSDLYLRTVIRNSADSMLVIDDDQRIRYASPAVRQLVGKDELPPLATLDDLVHPVDRAEVHEALRGGGDGVLYCSLQGHDEHQVVVEITYRDLREDRLVQGYVVTMRKTGASRETVERLPHLDHVDELPAWVNRRSAQHKFRY